MGGEGAGPNAQMIRLCAGCAFAALLRQRVQIDGTARVGSDLGGYIA